ncbi:hypothetical protein L2E82_51637 [Cichorium intybus]|nr:hypothetical protein L2E82_51637 [Cichorium intybus]
MVYREIQLLVVSFPILQNPIVVSYHHCCTAASNPAACWNFSAPSCPYRRPLSTPMSCTRKLGKYSIWKVRTDKKGVI